MPAALVDDLERLARSIPGVVVEHKGIAVALHYRAVPAMKPVLEKELQGLLDAHTNRLVLSHGRRVFELAPASSTKGTALARLMQLPSFQGRRPVMIGDDLPDEAALETATRLGGLALKVRGSVSKTVRSSFATRRMCAGGFTTSQRRLIHDHSRPRCRRQQQRGGPYY